MTTMYNIQRVIFMCIWQQCKEFFDDISDKDVDLRKQKNENKKQGVERLSRYSSAFVDRHAALWLGEWFRKPWPGII